MHTGSWLWSTTRLCAQRKDRCMVNLLSLIQWTILWGRMCQYWNGTCSPESLEWLLSSWRESERLQQKSVEVLEKLKSTFPEKNGVMNGWKFEKAHSILHKVRELILFGWSENFSTQGPEHCHIDFIKKIGHCTNNKTIRFHANFVILCCSRLCPAKETTRLFRLC